MSKEQVRLTLIDGPTLLIEVAGIRILTDPTFDAPQVYDTGVRRREKFNAPALPSESLLPIHAVLLSHDQHGDNLDGAGRAFLPRAETVISTVGAAERLGGNTRGLVPWSSTSLTVTATPARHGPAGFERVNGEVIGFVLAINEYALVYISGDTVWYSGIADVARTFDVGLAILFAGAAQPRGPFNVTMNSNDAIEATVAFSRAKIAAVHNLGWSHYKQSQEDLAEALGAVGLEERFLHLFPAAPVTIEV